MGRERRWQGVLAASLVLAALGCVDGPGSAVVIPPPPPPPPAPPPPPPVPLMLILAPAARSASAQSGTTPPGDSAVVTVTGDGAINLTWSATSRLPRTTLVSGSGTGSGMVRWLRSSAGLPVGFTVDTITVTAAGASGSPAALFDTLRITAEPVPLSLALSATHRSNSIVQGSALAGDSVLITLNGDGSGALPWTATRRSSWLTLAASSGIGSGWLRWSRSAAGLTVGSWVDTVTVMATGASNSPATFLDTVVVNPVIPPPPPPPSERPDLGLNASLHGRRFFPDNSEWNRIVSNDPVDPNSTAILTKIGLTKSLHPDYGADFGGPFGIPYIVVPDTLTRSNVTFDYASESDPGPYPIPPNPPIEPGGGDQHLLVITQDEWKLFELYLLVPGSSGWTAGSGAIFDLTTGALRPAGWTSADAAGLPILPGLVRYDEVVQLGEIRHALRFTVQQTRSAYIAPARHSASSSNDPLRPPMGMRVRLKASFNISGYPAAAQVVLRALKLYGMIVADNGGDFFLTGTADARWNDDVNNTLKQVKVGDFEVVLMVGVVDD